MNPIEYMNRDTDLFKEIEAEAERGECGGVLADVRPEMKAPYLRINGYHARCFYHNWQSDLFSTKGEAESYLEEHRDEEQLSTYEIMVRNAARFEE